ncbi:natural killer cells antigen CD94-like [Lepisosteus oculatus]|uniref:natural killer cells antigen CD94-like n=1 Tax=Lepisosteus oculatus TaxID=7918 RepID=UPI0037136D79
MDTYKEYIGLQSPTQDAYENVSTPRTEPRGEPDRQSRSRSCVSISLGVTVCVLLVTVIALGTVLWNQNSSDCKSRLEKKEKELEKLRQEAERYRKRVEIFCVDLSTGRRKQQCCPEGWKGGDSGRCYYISTDQRSWEFASHFCSSVGAQLLETEDKRELNFLGSLLEGYFYWIGLRKDSSSEWRWVNGTELNKDVITVKTGYSDGDCACGYWSGDVFTAYSRKCEETFSWICVGDPV